MGPEGEANTYVVPCRKWQAVSERSTPSTTVEVESTQSEYAGPNGTADAADVMNKGAAAPAHNAATLPKARILLAPNTLTSCFEPPQGNAAERTLT